MKNDFYIGYLPKGPKRNMRFVLGVVIFLFIVSMFFGWIIAMSQDKINNGSYEYGNLTELEGVIFNEPVPTLRILSRDSSQQKDIILINFGKFGAETSIQAFEKRMGGPAENYIAKVRGTLVYQDGITMLELTENDNALIDFKLNTSAAYSRVQKSPQETDSKLIGEIVDSKCYFGSMKPGNNKPHRSCAALCISGGIPPVFVVSNQDGSADYYLFKTDNKQELIDQILPYVGDRIEISSSVLNPNQEGYWSPIGRINSSDLKINRQD